MTAPAGETAIGSAIDVRLGPTAALSKEIESGAAFDLAVLTTAAIEDFTARGAIAPGTRTDIAQSCVGATVTPGLPLPDIGSVEALKRTLLAAKRVCYTLSGASGKHFASILPKLGIEKEIAAKALVIDGFVAERVVKGEADLGFQQLSEIRAVAGSVLVGAIPDEVNLYTVFSAGLAAKTARRDKAAALLRELASPATLKVAVAKGLDPV